MAETDAARIGVFGGSFDPVHLGHLTVAQDAVEQLELDRLLFVPAAISPHKQDAVPTEGRHRLAMLRLATEDNPSFAVSDMELARGGVSYTVETLAHVHEACPKADLFFIVGLDSLRDMHRWRQVDRIFDLCTVVPLARGGEDPAAVERQSGLPDPLKKQLLDRLIRIHEVEVSSSEIRMRAAEGLSLRYLVPPGVQMYIAEHHLYV